MPLRPGDRFGRYELAELLGTGGMADVYRARDTVLHRQVALKLLRGTQSGTWEAQISAAEGAVRILREARLAAAIGHPNAISIYDVGAVDGVPFLAMELVDGCTLRPFIGDPAVRMERRIRWLVEVARALGAAHQLGLVHRDIKPENVMVRGDDVAKVLDFGIARRSFVAPDAAPDSTAHGLFSAEGVVVGTPVYMAPEQMRGEAVDGRADQFAWGVLAYELLTGDLPWDRRASPVQVVAHILSGEVDAPRARNPAIPVQVDAAIRVALAKTPAHRFDRMEDLAEELEPHAVTAAVAAVRPSQVPPAPVTAGVAKAPPSPDESTHVTVAEGPALRPAPAVRWAKWARWAKWKWAATGVAVLAVGAGGSRLAARGHAPEVEAAPPLHAEQTGAERTGAERTGAEQTGPEQAGAAPSAMSADPGATAAYRAGMQAVQDASIATAMRELDRAVQLDPAFAAAHLRRALLSSGEMITAATRTHLQSADRSRASLGEHDRALLDAALPWSFSPPDLRESRRRLERAVSEHPSDADFAYHLAVAARDTDDTDDGARADAAFDAAIALDPTFALALRMKARQRVALGDVVGAAAAYERCLAVSQAATACVEDRVMLQAASGMCEEMASSIRSLLSFAPDVPRSYGLLAQALFSVGQPIDAVRAALTQKWDRTPPRERRATELRDAIALAILTGRFAEADRVSVDLEREIEGDPDDAPHFAQAYDRILMSLEVGKSAQAGALAGDYLRRRPAWVVGDVGHDPVILVHAASLAAGAITRDRFDALRDEWLTRDRARIEGVGLGAAPYAGSRWAFAHGLPAASDAEATAALASLPDARPRATRVLSPLLPLVDEAMGRAYLLGGRASEAIPLLARASGACAVTEPLAPLFSTWAAFDLGRALEAREDVAGACAAYQRVLGRWGEARPASRTATRARARVAALRCHAP